MIPKTLHYCWFGGSELPEMAERCIESWRRFCPDYHIRRWDEDAFDVLSNSFTSSAYESGRFAFVSDYVRALALAEHGGVYLDTDVELKANLDRFLTFQAFSGFEGVGTPLTAVWGARQGHPWPRRVLREYKREIRQKEAPNTRMMRDLLSEEYGIDVQEDAFQVGNHGIAIFPSSTFCLDLPQNVATHHFAGSWKSHDNARRFKQVVHARWHYHEAVRSTRLGSKHAHPSDVHALLILLRREVGLPKLFRGLAAVLASRIAHMGRGARRFIGRGFRVFRG